MPNRCIGEIETRGLRLMLLILSCCSSCPAADLVTQLITLNSFTGAQS
jgi:hypothetical protein